MWEVASLKLVGGPLPIEDGEPEHLDLAGRP